MSWDVDEKEFYETFAEIESDRGTEDAKLWAWTALDWTQKELRKKEGELREERSAIVLMPCECANAPHPIEHGAPSLSPAGRGLLLLHADLIERGEHLRDTQ